MARKLIVAVIALLVVAGVAFRTYEYAPVRYFGPNGEDMAPSGRKVWRAEVTPSTANGYSIDISSAGFNTIQGVYITPRKNTNAADAPVATIKSMTNTALVVNLQASNSAVVSILGINVLSGLPLIFPADITGVTLLVTVTGK